MAALPRHPRLDSTLALLRAPYDFISKSCRALGSDVFETRLMLRRTICMSGREAAQLFYDARHFQRRHAAPLRLQQSLLGTAGVQTVDDQVHAHRKQMFLTLMTPPRIAVLVALFRHEFMAAAQRWSNLQRIVLYDELHEILTRSVCNWAGVPLAPDEVAQRTRQLTVMFDHAGAVGPSHWRARQARNQAERWLAGLIRSLRAGEWNAASQTPIYHIAFHRELDGQQLSPRVAAMELLNLLRPTVALSTYMVFVAHALHLHPRCKVLLTTDPRYAEWFVQEVRRLYPFFPAVPARVRHDFEWHGYHFPAHRRVMLDLHGVNHDARLWPQPEEFRPERFRDWNGDPFALIPQGGGDHVQGHRCAGEGVTLELMKAALDLLALQMSYQVPAQDLSIDTTRLPALPRSRFVISNVQCADAAWWRGTISDGKSATGYKRV
jgi:fatty-acid peroxygenase